MFVSSRLQKSTRKEECGVIHVPMVLIQLSLKEMVLINIFHSILIFLSL